MTHSGSKNFLSPDSYLSLDKTWTRILKSGTDTDGKQTKTLVWKQFQEADTHDEIIRLHHLPTRRQQGFLFVWFCFVVRGANTRCALAASVLQLHRLTVVNFVWHRVNGPLIQYLQPSVDKKPMLIKSTRELVIVKWNWNTEGRNESSHQPITKWRDIGKVKRLW